MVKNNEYNYGCGSTLSGRRLGGSVAFIPIILSLKVHLRSTVDLIHFGELKGMLI